MCSFSFHLFCCWKKEKKIEMYESIYHMEPLTFTLIGGNYCSGGGEASLLQTIEGTIFLNCPKIEVMKLPDSLKKLGVVGAFC